MKTTLVRYLVFLQPTPFIRSCRRPQYEKNVGVASTIRQMGLTPTSYANVSPECDLPTGGVDGDRCQVGRQHPAAPVGDGLVPQLVTAQHGLQEPLLRCEEFRRAAGQVVAREPQSIGIVMVLSFVRGSPRGTLGLPGRRFRRRVAVVRTRGGAGLRRAGR